MQKQKGRQTRQQAYYSVSSAAQLIRDEMTRVQYQGVERWDEYKCNRSDAAFLDAQHEDVHACDPFRTTKEQGLSLTKLIARGAEKVYRSKLQWPSIRESFSGWSEQFSVDDGVCPVDVTVKMDRDYRLTFVLSPADPELAEDYRVSLVCTGQIGEPVETLDSSECSHVILVWDFEANQNKNQRTTFPITIHYYTTDITWTRGTISKGVSRDEG